MAEAAPSEIYLSFFMLTADMQPDNPQYAKVIAGHMRSFLEIGYDGFDLPIAPTQTADHAAEVAQYARLRDRVEQTGLSWPTVTTNVGTTRRFDPTSPYREQRDCALAYLKSRVDIAMVLGATVMAGPIIFPYGVFPVTDGNAPIWSDALQDWLAAGYDRARHVLAELSDYAAGKCVKLAIEPVDHWETAAPNMVADVLAFLEKFPNDQLGVCIDSAHVVLGSSGPAALKTDVRRAIELGRLHYVHISAPDRGAIHDSWIPWDAFLLPILPNFRGPFLVEVFNAIPPFLNGLRLTRRKFWLPNEDEPTSLPSAYEIARLALTTVRNEVHRIGTLLGPQKNGPPY